MKLNCVEALAAGLYLCRQPDKAEELLREFGWGKAFPDVNRATLERYGKCKGEKEIKEEERKMLQEAVEEKQGRGTRDILGEMENQDGDDDGEVEEGEDDAQTLENGFERIVRVT